MLNSNLEELVLETDRLYLKVLDEHFAPQVLDYYQRNNELLKQWEPLRDREFYTIPSQQNILQGEFDKIQTGQLFRVWLFKKEEDFRKPIGTVALSNIVRGAFQSCHLGYKLDVQEINQGYMTEAVQAVTRYAFEDLRLHRIEANIIPRNQASMKVVQKLGFYDEGLAKKYLKINGIWEDHIHMVLLNVAME
ncbi:MAG TPA: GNAT family N-acetyltransferase [Candidatus Deferrimicrobium sp.]|nr:GNAT family N-acetyltransferase [Candidatus Deferrimicrobium sp.]